MSNVHVILRDTGLIHHSLAFLETPLEKVTVSPLIFHHLSIYSLGESSQHRFATLISTTAFATELMLIRAIR